MEESEVKNEAEKELEKSSIELIKDSIREANTLPQTPAMEKENLDIIKHLIKRLAIHQIVLEEKADRTNRLLLFLSILSLFSLWFH